MTPREEAQAQIRAELDRHRPLEVSRRTLELIAEMAVRYSAVEGKAGFQVVDESGAQRFMERGGERVPMDIPGLVADIRERHPALFEAPAPAGSEPARGSLVVDAPAPPEPRSRDWLMIGGVAGAAEAAPAPAPREAAPAPAGEPARSRPARAAGALISAGTGVGGMAKALHARARLASQGVSDRIGAARDAIHERRATIADAPLRAAPAAGGFEAPPVERTGPRPLAPATPSAPRVTPYVYGLALLLAGLLLYALWPTGAKAPAPNRPAVASAPAPARAEPEATGGVPARPAAEEGVLRGVPEVVDTVTLRMEGRVVRLFGVEWARGGQPDDLTSYLRDRETECRPVSGSNAYRCTVNGQDLSRVVLFNGGGRTTAEATPELLKAEDHARDAKLGVWKR
ncbi:thermonuclease family protein [Salinarimonas soli]|uniref:TNase-like domain-containing protein n=1 Tax=Salinarimonas soli TaxID=1638099 RepID=A0A5B2VFT4_9HYPH|nr:hypothetical protein [Salinarimonas soli]KAA2237330.1 hypothetical protein F0L46_10035 [Salinarimonas soli]